MEPLQLSIANVMCKCLRAGKNPHVMHIVLSPAVFSTRKSMSTRRGNNLRGLHNLHCLRQRNEETNLTNYQNRTIKIKPQCIADRTASQLIQNAHSETTLDIQSNQCKFANRTENAATVGTTPVNHKRGPEQCQFEKECKHMSDNGSNQTTNINNGN